MPSLSSATLVELLQYYSALGALPNLQQVTSAVHLHITALEAHNKELSDKVEQLKKTANANYGPIGRGSGNPDWTESPWAEHAVRKTLESEKEVLLKSFLDLVQKPEWTVDWKKVVARWDVLAQAGLVVSVCAKYITGSRGIDKGNPVRGTYKPSGVNIFGVCFGKTNTMRWWTSEEFITYLQKQPGFVARHLQKNLAKNVQRLIAKRSKNENN